MHPLPGTPQPAVPGTVTLVRTLALGVATRQTDEGPEVCLGLVLGGVDATTGDPADRTFYIGPDAALSLAAGVPVIGMALGWEAFTDADQFESAFEHATDTLGAAMRAATAAQEGRPHG